MRSAPSCPQRAPQRRQPSRRGVEPRRLAFRSLQLRTLLNVRTHYRYTLKPALFVSGVSQRSSPPFAAPHAPDSEYLQTVRDILANSCFGPWISAIRSRRPCNFVFETLHFCKPLETLSKNRTQNMRYAKRLCKVKIHGSVVGGGVAGAEKGSFWLFW